MQHLVRKRVADELLDSIAAHVAILNSQGEIIAVNSLWKQFARENGGTDENFFVGTNYLTICKNALQSEYDETAEKAYHGLRAIIQGEQNEFSLEYPCHSPTEERWFVMRATGFEYQGDALIFISHENITFFRNALNEIQNRFRKFIWSLPDVIYTLDLTERQVTNFNRESFLGYSYDELIAPGSIQKHTHPEDAAVLSAYWKRVLGGETTEGIEYRIQNKNGQWEWVDSREIVISSNPDGTPKEIMVVLRVITDRKRADEQIAYHAKILENLSDVIIGVDENFVITYWNPAAERTFGWRPEEVIGKTASEILQTTFSEGGREDSIRAINETGTWKGEVIQYTKDNRPLNIDANIMTIRNQSGKITGFVSANRDITERKQAEEKLAHAYRTIEEKNRELELSLDREYNLARTDGLTGIKNYRHFSEIATYEIAMANRYQHPLSILLFDIDKFKKFNDTLGHQFGDEMLKHVAQTAEQRLRETDILARYGGEEFIAVLPNTTSKEAFIVAEDVREHIAASGLDSKKGRAIVTISIGIAETLPNNNNNILEKLIQRADKALYKAKKTGRNRTMVYPNEIIT